MGPRLARCDHDFLICKYNGRPIAAKEIQRAVREIHGGNAEKRVVLRNPYE